MLGVFGAMFDKSEEGTNSWCDVCLLDLRLTNRGERCLLLKSAIQLPAVEGQDNLFGSLRRIWESRVRILQVWNSVKVSGPRLKDTSAPLKIFRIRYLCLRYFFAKCLMQAFHWFGKLENQEYVFKIWLS